jgi:hypothetical protein
MCEEPEACATAINVPVGDPHASETTDGIVIQMHVNSVSDENVETPRNIAYSQWLHDPSLSIAERRCRILVLHRVCDMVLHISPQQRPRSLAALANFTKNARKVRSYTVTPLLMLQHLNDVPQELINFCSTQPRPFTVSEDILEEPSAAHLHSLECQWRKSREHLSKQSVGEQSRWIGSLAYVLHAYAAEQITMALRDLGILTSTDFGEGMEKDQVRKRLPMPELVPEHPWSVLWPEALHTLRRYVSMPAGCFGAFMGVGGEKCSLLTTQLQEHASTANVFQAPKVVLMLKLFDGRKGPGKVELRIQWARWEKQRFAAVAAAQAVDAMANELQQLVVGNINEIFRKRLVCRTHRRNRKAERRRAMGEVYHRRLRAARSAKLVAGCDTACRGLQLPPAGISVKRGANRKAAGQQRRRVFLKQKRQAMLQACDSVRTLCASKRQFIPLALVEALQTNGGCESPAVFTKGGVRGMLQHLSSCAEEVGVNVLDAFNHAKDRRNLRPKQARAKQSRQQKRATAIQSQFI